MTAEREKRGLRCVHCRRSLRGVAKLFPHARFSEQFNRACPSSPDKLCLRQTIERVKAGSGKKAIEIVFDAAEVPSRGASLRTRARWGSEYLKRFFSGQEATKKNLDLALKWIDETIELCRGTEEIS